MFHIKDGLSESRKKIKHSGFKLQEGGVKQRKPL